VVPFFEFSVEDEVDDGCIVVILLTSSCSSMLRVSFGVFTELAPRASVADVAGVAQIGDVDEILFVIMIADGEDASPVVLGSALAALESLVALHVAVVSEDDSDRVEVIVAVGGDAFEEVVGGVSLTMMSQACDAGMDVASFVVAVVAVIDVAGGSDGADVDISDVQDSVGDVGDIIDGIDVGAEEIASEGTL